MFESKTIFFSKLKQTLGHLKADLIMNNVFILKFVVQILNFSFLFYISYRNVFKMGRAYVHQAKVTIVIKWVQINYGFEDCSNGFWEEIAFFATKSCKNCKQKVKPASQEEVKTSNYFLV